MEPVKGKQGEGESQSIEDHKEVPDISLWRDHVKRISRAKVLNLQLINQWIETNE